MAFKKKPPTPWRKSASGYPLYQDQRGRCSGIVFPGGTSTHAWSWHVSGPGDKQDDGHADTRGRAIRHVEARAYRWGCRVNRLPYYTGNVADTMTHARIGMEWCRRHHQRRK